MNRIKQRATTVWLSLFLCCLVFLLGTDGLVLCFETDGRTMVEPALGCYSCKFSSKQLPHETICAFLFKGDNSLSAQCVSCIDVPLFSCFINQSEAGLKKGMPLIKTPVITAYLLKLSSFAGMVFNYRSFQPLNPGNSFPISLNSVILQI